MCLAALFALEAVRPTWAGKETRTVLVVLLSLGAGTVLVRLLEYLCFDLLFIRHKGREAPDILRFVVSIVGYSSLLVFIFTFVLNRSLSPVLATSAVVSVVIGLALQDTLGNFFAGLSLHIDEPYHIGDAIRLGDAIGRVESVTWRTTALRTNNNSLVVFPNSKIAREPIEIYPLNNENRRILRFPAPYSIPPEHVITAVREVARTLPDLSPGRVPSVRVAEFADSSVTYEVLFWTHDYMLVHDLEARLRERIWYLFGRNGWEIPFPVRHVLMERAHPQPPRSLADYNAVLASIEFFAPLSEKERADLARQVTCRVYAPGELVVSQGDAGASMFIIDSGKAEVLVPGPHSRRRVAVLEKGDFFGEMALFTGESRSADVVALEELALLEVAKPAMEMILRDNVRLVEAFGHVIAARHAGLEQLSQTSPREELVGQKASILERIRRFFGV
jgi:small-conductance mechanosensitive channel/CRP-like cAMP-binding protein